MVGGADLLGLPALCQGGFLAHVARPRVPTCPVPPDANGSTRALVVPDLPVLTSGRSLSGITRRCDHSSCARDLRSVGPATMINLRVIALRVLASLRDPSRTLDHESWRGFNRHLSEGWPGPSADHGAEHVPKRTLITPVRQRRLRKEAMHSRLQSRGECEGIGYFPSSH